MFMCILFFSPCFAGFPSSPQAVFGPLSSSRSVSQRPLPGSATVGEAGGEGSGGVVVSGGGGTAGAVARLSAEISALERHVYSAECLAEHRGRLRWGSAAR